MHHSTSLHCACHRYEVTLHALLKRPLEVLVYDEDGWWRDDDFLGGGAIDATRIKALVQERADDIAALGPESRTPASKFRLELSTQGSVTIEVAVEHVHTPTDSDLRQMGWSTAWTETLRPLLRKGRAWMLYHRVPYDLGPFDKMRNWKAMLLTFIASSTNQFVRGAFFTLYLLGISVELEECPRQSRAHSSTNFMLRNAASRSIPRRVPVLITQLRPDVALRAAAGTSSSASSSRSRGRSSSRARLGWSRCASSSGGAP